MGDLLVLPPPVHSNRHVLYVYGTLRTGAARLYAVPGAIYDLGTFPGAILFLPNVQAYILCERIIVDDVRLQQIDDFEGYRKDDLKGSLYIRKPIYDGWIYTYNNSLNGKPRIRGLIDETVGDWLDWCERMGKSGLRPLSIRGTNVQGDITPTKETAPLYDDITDKAFNDGLVRARVSSSNVVAQTQLMIPPPKPKPVAKKRLLGLFAGGAK